MEADARRHASETAFFDSEEYAEGPIPQVTIDRYLRLNKPWLPAEYPFWLLGDLEGKNVLELACGDGGNAIILGLRGGRVKGIDISRRAIEVARRRAELHGVADRVDFLCAPLEAYAQSETARFDVICGWAALHHVIPVLDSVLADLKKLAHENTLFVFSEPVSMWQWLRRLRLTLPIPVHATPDERPLEPGELAVLRRHLPGLQARYFGTALRAVHRLLQRNYEKSSWPVRLSYDSAARFDNFLLQTIGIKGLASTATFFSGPTPEFTGT